MFMILKIILAIGIIICSAKIGILLSQKYRYRLEELDELKNDFKIIENKIKYTYEPLEEIFTEIAEISTYSISELFKNVADNIKEQGREQARKNQVKTIELSLKKEDKKVLKEFGILLGKTNKEGQINQINFVNELLERQIEKAKTDKDKNETMYKKLGVILGVGLVIILI